MMEFKQFNALCVPLKGSNLIEASAGTGKTYSIAILALRLILEERIQIREILMVTFTKAAVAELEERIRLFIRQAYRVSQGAEIADQAITRLVTQAIKDSNPQEIQAVLKDAVLLLDEISVLTIHSFCQQSLNEFAFETGQLFGADLLQDTSGLRSDEINKFWRKFITVIPVALLKDLLLTNLSRVSISGIVKEHLEGKKYFNYKLGEDYNSCDADYQQIITELQELREKEEELRSCIVEKVVRNTDAFKALCTGGHLKKVLPTLEDPQEFLKFIWEKRDKQYVQKAFSALIEELEGCEALLKKRNEHIKALIRKINCLAIQEVSSGIGHHKMVNNQMTYDDLIQNLHTALVKKENPALIECLHKKYKAVFIDEFQDTDRIQYEVFKTAFAKDTITFYIGDPKQSIYAWRKADIHTYFKAKQEVEQLYSMNHNYRSSAKLIDSMNLFFMPTPDFDTFYFKKAEASIDYIDVESPPVNTKGLLRFEGKEETPISITECPKSEDLLEAVAGQVVSLLQPGVYKILKSNKDREILPSDIGILVRFNWQVGVIKRKLASYGIPAVAIGDEKVLQSEEAKYLLYLLEAMVDISLASINKALLSPFTGLTDVSILTVDDEMAIALFRKYKVIWEAEGIYIAMNSFITDYKLRQLLLTKKTDLGERVLTNLLQLVEILHKVQSAKKLSPLELIAWLKRGIDGDERAGDGFEQRIESDEAAVKIVTIHKSKGLEYNIVLAPFLDFVKNTKFETCSFRDAESGEYVSLETGQLTIDQREEWEKQLEQENRRLVYVAITRAVYKCFVFRNTKSKATTLATFTDAIGMKDTSLVRFEDAVGIADDYVYISREVQPIPVLPVQVQFKLSQHNWQRMSYTKLRADHALSLKTKSDVQQEGYENFIFNQLVKGAKTGNMLHNIFENIDFNNTERWDYAIKAAVQRYAPLQAELYLPMLKELLHHVLNADLCISENRFNLSAINSTNRINELEFDFKVSPFKVAELDQLSDEDTDVVTRDYHEMEGVMNGMVDVFFEHEGLYYVLDWKSNFLGNMLSDYEADKLSVAMNENNYHLQYLIYTLAVKKYLESRLPGFDYERQFGGVFYLFLRGVRAGSANGVFAVKPTLEKMMQLSNVLLKVDQEALSF